MDLFIRGGWLVSAGAQNPSINQVFAKFGDYKHNKDIFLKKNMADNNLSFKVLAELSDTEYFTFLIFFPLTGWGSGP